MTSSQFKIVLAAVLIGSGCSQILGLSDYEVVSDEPSEGGDTGQGGDGPSTGGKNTGGKNQSGDAGMGATEPEGGSAPIAGASTGVGGTGEEGGAGVGGEAQGGSGSDLIPCSSADCCTLAEGTAVGDELLADPGFELGTVVDGNPYWTQDTTTLDLELITTAGNGWAPHGGTYFAYLSGIADEQSFLWTEDITIPAGTGWIEVSGWRRFQIDMADATNFDYCLVNFYGYEADSHDEFLFDWGDPAISPDGWGGTANWTRFTASFDAAPHVGMVRYLAFLGVSDDYPATGETIASSYLFDDMSIKAFRCER